MKFRREFTTELRKGESPRALFNWKTVKVLMRDNDGNVLCDVPKLEVPEGWSQQAAEILANKYLRKKGISTTLTRCIENDVPIWLQRARPKIKSIDEFVGESSMHQVARRLAGGWTYTGWKNGYFGEMTNGKTIEDLHGIKHVINKTSERNAKIFYDEIYYILCAQIAAPNSPQWFNTGLWWSYGIDSGTNQHYRWDKDQGAVVKLTDAQTYEFPSASACFILGLDDNLIDEGGIMDTLSKETAIFKFGSGSGINYSKLRGKGEGLSHGGRSSGLMSFLDIFDKNAGAIKSGGTSRRAARMVVVDIDHPEASDFIKWKSEEEDKVLMMERGANTTLQSVSIYEEDEDGNPIHIGYDMADDEVDFLKTLTTDYESEAYNTVSGQNSNNSVRVTDQYMDLVCDDSCESPETWKGICDAAWKTGDPGLHFGDTINKWNMVPKFGEIRASNPCSEFVFPDFSACTLASMNLIKFVNDKGDGGKSFNYQLLNHVTRMMTTVLDITIEMGSYPDAKVAENSWKYRPLGLGYANLGGLLMSFGIAYGSDEGRKFAAKITAHMHFKSWRTSQELAKQIEPMFEYERHSPDIKKVFDLHVSEGYELYNDRNDWDIGLRNDQPIRNAQMTLLAPTGTIGLVMDCATTGIEPDFSLIKFKRLAGGGSMEIVNPLTYDGLSALGYEGVDIAMQLEYLHKNGVLDETLLQDGDEHVFDCANDIHWRDHILMMAAVQPFLSGAISKTVNFPNNATVEDISEAYTTAYEKGIKAIAVYRDGCKHSQPLNRVVNEKNDPHDDPVIIVDEKTFKRIYTQKVPLPFKRLGFTQKVYIANHSIYLTTGEYEDGSLGEIFVSIGMAGSDVSALMNDWAKSISIALQHGVRVEQLAETYTGSRSNISGIVQGSSNIRICSSITDYIFRELMFHYGPTSHDDKNETVTTHLTESDMINPNGNGQLQTIVKPNVKKKVRYTGDYCPECSNMTLRRDGHCFICDTCGTTTGCG